MNFMALADWYHQITPTDTDSKQQMYLLHISIQMVAKSAIKVGQRTASIQRNRNSEITYRQLIGLH